MVFYFAKSFRHRSNPYSATSVRSISQPEVTLDRRQRAQAHPGCSSCCGLSRSFQKHSPVPSQRSFISGMHDGFAVSHLAHRATSAALPIRKQDRKCKTLRESICREYVPAAFLPKVCTNGRPVGADLLFCVQGLAGHDCKISGAPASRGQRVPPTLPLQRRKASKHSEDLCDGLNTQRRVKGRQHRMERFRRGRKGLPREFSQSITGGPMHAVPQDAGEHPGILVNQAFSAASLAPTASRRPTRRQCNGAIGGSSMHQHGTICCSRRACISTSMHGTHAIAYRSANPLPSFHALLVVACTQPHQTYDCTCVNEATNGWS